MKNFILKSRNDMLVFNNKSWRTSHHNGIYLHIYICIYLYCVYLHPSQVFLADRQTMYICGSLCVLSLQPYMYLDMFDSIWINGAI